jgi:hypothetical protein
VEYPKRGFIVACFLCRPLSVCLLATLYLVIGQMRKDGSSYAPGTARDVGRRPCCRKITELPRAAPGQRGNMHCCLYVQRRN